MEETPNGFPRLAAFQASEPNFSLYRSFSYLHSRVLLDLQDQITCLEKELDEIDWEDHDEDADRLKSRDYDTQQPDGEGEPRTRRVILREIQSKLLEYGEYQTMQIYNWISTLTIIFRRGPHQGKDTRVVPKTFRPQLPQRPALLPQPKTANGR